MFTDILFIITTAFALFGIYCLAETISDMVAVSKFPPTITVIATENEEQAFRKIKYIEQNVPNNYTFLYTVQKAENTDAENSLLNQFVKDVLYVNNK